MTEPRYVFRCGKDHRVAVDPGRYWLPARCPKCGLAVDARRLARGWAWARGSAPRSRVRVGRLSVAPLDAGAWLLVGALVAVAVVYRVAGDTTWWGTIMLYAGRWPWLALPALLLLVGVTGRRTVLIPALAALLVVLGPVMGGRISLRSLLASPDKPFRVVTYNAESGRIVSLRVPELLERHRPDVVAFQECGASLKGVVAGLPGWALADTGAGGLCLLSKYPAIGPRTVMPAQAFRDAGGAANVVRYTLATPSGPVAFFNLHLETPRHGIEHIFRDASRAPGEIRANTLLRETESRVARRWIDSTSGPRIIVGDFNLPVESAIYRRYWGDLEESWSAAGTGFGFSKLNGWIRVRIDHALSSGGVHAARVLVGQDYGSDHLPVITDFLLGPSR